MEVDMKYKILSLVLCSLFLVSCVESKHSSVSSTSRRSDNQSQELIYTIDQNDHANTSTSSSTKSEHEQMVELGMVPSIDLSLYTVTYGLYPQKVVTDSTLVASLETLTTTNRNGWVFYEGSYYAKNKDSSEYLNRRVGSSDGKSVWFKCSQIKWRILSKQDNTYVLLSDSLLDCRIFNYKASTYKESGVRKWLNEYFYDTAFFDPYYIQTTEVDNSAATTLSNPNIYECEATKDKVYLLSYKDYINTPCFWNDESRKAEITDWAISNGVTDIGFGNYWTRSPCSEYSLYCVSHITNNGKLQGTNPNSICCVRPAITIKI